MCGRSGRPRACARQGESTARGNGPLRSLLVLDSLHSSAYHRLDRGDDDIAPPLLRRVETRASIQVSCLSPTLLTGAHRLRRMCALSWNRRTAYTVSQLRL
jgi:hypothetical protein